MNKKLFTIIVAIFSLTSCNQPRKIVTDVPIKANILGVELCEKMTFNEVQNALYVNCDNYFYTETYKDGNVEVYSFADSDIFIFGGLSWVQFDTYISKNFGVYKVRLVGSFETLEGAKKHYDSAVEIFAQKYGKGNVRENYIFWTDNVNSVELSYEKSSAIDGSDRSFCILSYSNNELVEKVKSENQPDI